MSTAEDPRFAPPQAHVEDVAPDTPALAGRGTRLMAALLDGVIAAAAGWGFGMLPVFRELSQAQVKAAEQGLWTWNPSALLIGVPLFLLIQGWPLVTRGQTIGKLLFKLRIVRTDGSKVDPLRLLGLRYGVGALTGVVSGVSMIYGLIDGLLIFRESRQCLHDTLADTKVIKL